MALLLGYIEDGVILRIVDRGTIEESPALRAAATAALASGHLVCDATDCEYLDSTLLGCLIGIKKESERRQAEFEIVADRQTQIKLFSTSSLDRFFDFVDQCPSPVGEMVTIQCDPLDTEELGRHVLECHKRLARLGGHDAEAFQRVVDRLEQELDKQARTNGGQQRKPDSRGRLQR